MTTIFVAIAAYRDPELPETVLSLFRNAGDPRRVRLAVVDQCAPEEAVPEFANFGSSIAYCQMHYTQSRGVGMARALAAQFYRGEDIYLQVDSHSQFEPGWDRWVEQTWRERPTPKSVFTSYPFPYSRESGQVVLQRQAPQTVVVAHVTQDATFDAEGKSWWLAPMSAYHHSPVRVPARHLSAGFVMGPGEMIAEVPPDPLLYFYGEEPTWAARLWTHGYDLWHPVDVPIYHLYNNAEQTLRPVPWRVEDDERRALRWWQMEESSAARQRALFTGALHGTIYGLGTARTLAQYAAYSGIDYVNRTVHPKAYAPQDLPTPSEKV